MNLQAAIARAALPESHVVCGVTLKPFCIGHWLHLNRFDVSFVTGATDHTLGDILIAVLVCSDSYEGFMESLKRGGIDRVMMQWQHKLSGGMSGVWRRRWAGWRGRHIEPNELIGFDLAEACGHFQRYLDEHGGGMERVNEWSIPITKATVGEGSHNVIYAPGFMVLLDALTSDLGLCESEALNVGLPWARWRWSIHAERKGWCNLVDADESHADQSAANDFAKTVFGNN